MFLLYAFISFIFFKVITVFMFNGSITVIAAGLCAAASALIMFFFTGSSFEPLIDRLTLRPASPDRVLLNLCGAVVASICACWAIAHGFSEKFMARYVYRDNELWFGLILAVPPAVHGLIVWQAFRDIIKQVGDEEDG